MQAGRLDQRVTLERFTTTTDDWGGPIEAWAPLATVWAAVEPLNGREFIAAMAVGVGRVEQGHAQFQGPRQGRQRLRVVGRAVELAHAHAAEADGRDGHPQRPEAAEG